MLAQSSEFQADPEYRSMSPPTQNCSMHPKIAAKEQKSVAGGQKDLFLQPDLPVWIDLNVTLTSKHIMNG